MSRLDELQAQIAEDMARLDRMSARREKHQRRMAVTHAIALVLVVALVVIKVWRAWHGDNP